MFGVWGLGLKLFTERVFPEGAAHLFTRLWATLVEKLPEVCPRRKHTKVSLSRYGNPPWISKRTHSFLNVASGGFNFVVVQFCRFAWGRELQTKQTSLTSQPGRRACNKPQGKHDEHFHVNAVFGPGIWQGQPCA